MRMTIGLSKKNCQAPPDQKRGRVMPIEGRDSGVSDAVGGLGGRGVESMAGATGAWSRALRDRDRARFSRFL